jgi:hypothetical protein
MRRLFRPPLGTLNHLLDFAVGADAVGADAVGADAVGADAVGADAVGF